VPVNVLPKLASFAFKSPSKFWLSYFERSDVAVKEIAPEFRQNSFAIGPEYFSPIVALNLFARMTRLRLWMRQLDHAAAAGTDWRDTINWHPALSSELSSNLCLVR
jgi:hypothetical protein